MVPVLLMPVVVHGLDGGFTPVDEGYGRTHDIHMTMMMAEGYE